MKLGFTLFDYFPFGGLQRDCLKIAGHCVARGHAVTIFTRTWEGERPAGVAVELFGRQGWTNVSRNRHWLKQLAATLPQRELDGVVGFNKMSGLDVYYGADPCYLAKVARLKPAWFRWLPRFKHFAALERAVYRRGNDTQVLLLKETEIPFYERYYGTEPGRFHLLPPGVSKQNFSEEKRLQVRRRMRAERTWSGDALLLLFVGSGFRVKGLDRAITAFAALPTVLGERAHLVVIGQNHSAEFAAQAGRLGASTRVHFLGGRHDVPDWMLAADAMIHPAYSETAGMVLVEALTFGLPVLTTDVCGYAFHIAKANAGIVLPSPFDQEQCNRALVEMLTSDKSSAWRANGLAYAAKEDLYSCHERAADIIEETIRRKIADSANLPQRSSTVAGRA